jgi:hypothetical protein
MRDLTGRLKPRVRCEAPVQQQERLILQLRHLEHWTPAQQVAFRQHRQEDHWIECSSLQARITCRHDRHFDVATMEQIPELTPPRFLQLNFDERMSAIILGKKIGQKTLNHVRRRTDAKQTGLAGL